MESKQLFKILLFFMIIVIIAICFKYKEIFTKNKNITEIILSSNKPNLKFNYNPVEIDEMTHKIFNESKNDPELVQKIKSRMVNVYSEINNDEKIKKFLKFNNLINDDGFPIFINESDDVLLKNEIKILLLTYNI